MIISDELINNTVAEYLNSLFDNLFFHVAYQSNNLPIKPFGTFYILSQNDLKSRKVLFDKENPKEEVITDISILIQIEIRSSEDNTLAFSNETKQNLKSSKAIYHFLKNGFEIKKVGHIVNLPEQINQEWVYRRTFDVTLHAKQSDTFDVDHILEADVSGSTVP